MTQRLGLVYRASFVVALSMALLVTALVSVATSAAALSDDASFFVGRVNQLRADLGLEALRVDVELTAAAQQWSDVMASNDQLAHSPDITGGITATWTVVGENVGTHGIHDLDGLFDAFVASPTHYENLVDPRFQYIGVAVVNTPEGKIWTTHRFMAIAEVDTQPLPDVAADSDYHPPPDVIVDHEFPVLTGWRVGNTIWY